MTWEFARDASLPKTARVLAGRHGTPDAGRQG